MLHKVRTRVSNNLNLKEKWSSKWKGGYASEVYLKPLSAWIMLSRLVQIKNQIWLFGQLGLLPDSGDKSDI